ncbi:hypothetical protein ACA910_014528 [Epithemia clementina (nom. ined.)]
MNASDVDRSGCLDRDEYFAFTKAYDSEGTYDSVDNADDAPVFWNTTWSNLLSVCQDNPTVDNCTEVNGLCLPVLRDPPPVEITNPTELHVFYVCWSTKAALTHSKDSSPPTISPSASPSALPSVQPSSYPSFSPTEAPTPQPTSAIPSLQPSAPPTRAPVVTSPPTPLPSARPSVRPTVSVLPTLAPTATESYPPTLRPSSRPSNFPVDLAESIKINLAFISPSTTFKQDVESENGENLLVGYFSDSDAAMAILWGRIHSESVRRRMRFLEKTITQPCQLTQTTQLTCPTTVDTPSTVCREVYFTCYLQVSGLDVANAAAISASSKETWEDEILGNGYQSILDSLRYGVNGQIRVLSSPNLSSVNEPPKETFNTAITGTVVSAAILLVMLPFMLLLFRRSRSQADKKQKVFDEPYDPFDDVPNELEPETVDPAIFTNHSKSSRTKPILGASKPSYVAKSTQKFLDDVERGEDILAEPEFDAERDSSSNAGSSGWSSSAGYSSYNTGSMDDSMDAAMAAGTTLAAIGVTSSLSNQMSDGRMSDGPGSTSVGSSSASVSRDQLDSYIEAGDWAAVGATAALLAAQSDSNSASTNSRSRRSRSSSYETDSVEAQRAAELDHLVDAGDWEGVVLAAARFEAAEMTVSSRGSRTASSVDSTGSHTHTDDDGGATGSSPSQSESATGSDDPSRARQRREVRAEVEALVRRVVPEEIDNVDEMMNQFKGREEELVETLRTMQERAIAQKARSAGHKTAKLEARKNVKRGVVPGAPLQSSARPMPPPTVESLSPKQAEALATPVVAPAMPESAEAEQPTNVPNATSSGTVSDGNDSSTMGSMQETRRSLDRAIDAGDWEAVGQAAAFLSDGSVGTNDTNGGPSPGEIERTAQSNLSTSTGASRRQAKDSETAIRAAELDEMINKGDWSGVVAAANRFSQMDKNTKSELGRTAEEEEALAQAEFWTNIANQKKAQGANDVGASDAAEWAIQRSLSQMKEADRKKDVAIPKKQAEEDEV